MKQIDKVVYEAQDCLYENLEDCRCEEYRKALESIKEVTQEEWIARRAEQALKEVGDE